MLSPQTVADFSFNARWQRRILTFGLSCAGLVEIFGIAMVFLVGTCAVKVGQEVERQEAERTKNNDPSHAQMTKEGEEIVRKLNARTKQMLR